MLKLRNGKTTALVMKEKIFKELSVPLSWTQSLSYQELLLKEKMIKSKNF